MSETKRGRIPYEAYVKTVGQMLTRNWYVLDQCEMLTQLEVIQYLVSVNPTKYPRPGIAVRALLDKAIDQVIVATIDNPHYQTQLTARFLQYRIQGITVSEIAKNWGFSREYISRTIGKQAITLVTDRVLKIGRRKLVAKEPEEEGATDVQNSQMKVKQEGKKQRTN